MEQHGSSFSYRSRYKEEKTKKNNSEITLAKPQIRDRINLILVTNWCM